MRFVILNVEHGFAAYATAQDESVLLFDCGYSSTTRPSDILYSQGVRASGVYSYRTTTKTISVTYLD